MKTIILSAGRSKRLKPVPDKSLLNFNGKASLLHKIESLSFEGFSDFVIVVGPHNKQTISDLLAQTDYTYQLVEQENLDQGMAGAMISVSKALKDMNEPILVVSNNDTVDQSLIQKLANSIQTSPDQSLIVGKKVSSYFPGGYIQHDDLMFLTNIVEKPEPGTEPSDMINLVYHYFASPKPLFDILTQTDSSKDDIYEVSLLSLVKAGQQFKVIPYAGEWIPIKNAQHIIQTARYFAHKERANGISTKAEVHPSAIIRGEVIIEEGAKIDANAVIQGPAYIGKNSIVGVGSFIRDSFIGDNCVVGFASEIARSYIGSHCWFHHNFIGDSVIGDNVSFGAGCITGNLRLDEQEILPGHTKVGLVTGDNIRVGIGTKFMPGITLGSNSMLGAGLVIAENIPDDSFVKGDYTLSIKPNTKQIPIR